jgi:hypothetical protein
MYQKPQSAELAFAGCFAATSLGHGRLDRAEISLPFVSDVLSALGRHGEGF